MNNKEPHIDDYTSRTAYDSAWDSWKAREISDGRYHHNETSEDIEYESPQNYGKKHLLDQHSPGAKMDHDKIDMSLLEFLPNALQEVCRVMDYGQVKYSRGGFLEVDDAKKRYTGAMFRHFIKESLGIKHDAGDPFYETEAGSRFKGTLRHDAQIAVNALFRLEVILRDEYEQHLIDTFLVEDTHE